MQVELRLVIFLQFSFKSKLWLMAIFICSSERRQELVNVGKHVRLARVQLERRWRGKRNDQSLLLLLLSFCGGRRSLNSLRFFLPRALLARLLVEHRLAHRIDDVLEEVDLFSLIGDKVEEKGGAGVIDRLKLCLLNGRLKLAGVLFPDQVVRPVSQTQSDDGRFEVVVGQVGRLWLLGLRVNDRRIIV